MHEKLKCIHHTLFIPEKNLEELQHFPDFPIIINKTLNY